ncbi:rhodanese-like domain-containing protein [Carbonactinospora thermoautotrophica]|uniref:rhodanese-like domain-containing protein n=1 Tax=Carbonactinospora thermoautotrophica TaxID=1469144 RepID=UPI000B13A420
MRACPLATVRHRRPVVVLDVRRNLEWAQAHIEDAVHIPLHKLLTRIHEVPEGEVWVHCQAGSTGRLTPGCRRSTVTGEGSGAPRIHGMVEPSPCPGYRALPDLLRDRAARRRPARRTAPLANPGDVGLGRGRRRSVRLRAEDDARLGRGRDRGAGFIALPHPVPGGQPRWENGAEVKANRVKTKKTD